VAGLVVERAAVKVLAERGPFDSVCVPFFASRQGSFRRAGKKWKVENDPP
jgi:hypothetical protein